MTIEQVDRGLDLLQRFVEAIEILIDEESTAHLEEQAGMRFIPDDYDS